MGGGGGPSAEELYYLRLHQENLRRAQEAEARTGLVSELAPRRLADVQVAAPGASPFFQAEQLGTEAEAVGGAFGTLDQYMALAKAYLGLEETDAAPSAAPAPGVTGAQRPEIESILGRRGATAPIRSGLIEETELGEFLGV